MIWQGNADDQRLWLVIPLALLARLGSSGQPPLGPGTMKLDCLGPINHWQVLALELCDVFSDVIRPFPLM